MKQIEKQGYGKNVEKFNCARCNCMWSSDEYSVKSSSFGNIMDMGFLLSDTCPECKYLNDKLSREIQVKVEKS